MNASGVPADGVRASPPTHGPVPPKTLAEVVLWFCKTQADFRAWLARAGGRDGDPREETKADGGAHQRHS